MLNITCSDHKTSSRYALIDFLRGAALILMFIYHFSFDLNYFQFIRTDFYSNPFWINFRSIIVSLFLWLVGVSLWLATKNGVNYSRYFKRLGYLIGAAIIVSLSSYITFPTSYIFFGILHFILVASIIGLVFTKLYYSNLILGIGLIFIAATTSHSVFNHDFLQWFGLMTYKPRTEDYVPFLPWFGVVLIGIFSARFIYTQQKIKLFSHWKAKSSASKTLCCMGRHSLLIYLLHQPIFMAILFIFKLMFR